jgi:molecular chaperone GrpE
MSGDGTQHEAEGRGGDAGAPEEARDAADARDADAGRGGESIPIEVVPPDAPADGPEARIAALEKEKKESWERYLRAAADLENFRKRQRRELDDARFETKGRILKEMLPVVDNLERAIEHAAHQAGAVASPIVEGVQLVLRQFMSAFERLEVMPVNAAGQPFDPTQHEAISQLESEQPPGTVIQVLQRGYRSGERLLRPALVVVAKAPAPKAE